MSDSNKSLNFIEQIVVHDIESGKHGGRIHTRFPPEPNGYLHIGHAKAICLNFELAKKYGGVTNLRFDDTNPVTEETEYVNAIKRDIKWLGYDWEDREYYTSDYFEKLYAFAEQLINQGDAYVDESTSEEIASMKGTPTEPGVDSPYRDRPREESLELLRKMKAGDFDEGAMVLRAKIDMKHPNLNMRDPVMYRIKYAHHHRTGDKWCIYPLYDFAHGQSDSIEEITHSLCSLEFENHRPLYNWFIERLGIFPSRQIEFSRLNLSYTIMSKRKLRYLVEEGIVQGWDDPRMPTLAAMRRRGYTPVAIKNFIERVGMTKRENIIDLGLLEYFVREDLNKVAERRMVVIRPLRVVITNYPEGEVEMLPAENNPEDAGAGTREMPFGREIYIDQADFMPDPPKKFFRMAPGRNTRLKHAYILHCEDYDLNKETGEVETVYCTYYPESKSGQDTSGIKSKGTLHWVHKGSALNVEVRLYDRLFSDENPDGHKDRHFTDFLNENSLEVIKNAKAEPALMNAQVNTGYQFLRRGYFSVDEDARDGHLIFNRTATLRDAWAKIQKKKGK